jgi:hypothetical protein
LISLAVANSALGLLRSIRKRPIAGVGKSNGERRIQEPVLERCLQDNDLVAVLKVTVLNDSASDDASSAH